MLGPRHSDGAGQDNRKRAGWLDVLIDDLADRRAGRTRQARRPGRTRQARRAGRTRQGGARPKPLATKLRFCGESSPSSYWVSY